MNSEEIQNFRKELQNKTLAHNCVAQFARKEERDYICSEDISEAFKIHSEDKVRLDTLEILGNCSGFSYEDGGLCAFVAFKGK